MTVLSRPALGRITQGFSAAHRALDFGWGLGKTVRSAASGWVRLEADAEYGLRIFIEHVAGDETEYSHLAGRFVKDKQWVPGKFKIATMGNSGSFAKFVHLHFAHWVRGVRVLPIFGGTSSPADSGTPLPILNGEISMLITKVTDGTDKGHYFATSHDVSREISAEEVRAHEAAGLEKHDVTADEMFRIRQTAARIRDAAAAPAAPVIDEAAARLIASYVKVPAPAKSGTFELK